MVEGAAHVSRQTSLRRSGELVLTIDDIQAGKPGPSVHNRRSSTGSSGDDELPRPEDPGRRRSVVEGASGPILRTLGSAAGRESFRNSRQLDAVLGAPNRGGATPRARRAESMTAVQLAGFGPAESRRASRFGEGLGEAEGAAGPTSDLNGSLAGGASVRGGASMRDGKQTRFAEEIAKVPPPEWEDKQVEMTGHTLAAESVKQALRDMQAAARERPNPLERTWDTFTQAHTPKRLNDLIREKSEVRTKPAGGALRCV